MDSVEEQKTLLERESLDTQGTDETACENDPTQRRTRSNCHYQPFFHRNFATIITLSLVLNLLLASLCVVTLVVRPSLPPRQSGISPNATAERDRVRIPSITGLDYDTPVEYLHYNKYWSINETEADEAWDSLPTDPMVVAIPDEWAAARGLPPTGRFPWDQSLGRYFIQAFHELHCLKYVRRYVVELERGGSSMAGPHAYHCLDTIRQGIMCRADDTLQPASDTGNFTIGDHQVRMCRDFDALIKWSNEPQRSGCHRVISDYKTIHNGIERFAFCADDSPFRETQVQYFKEHGHKDPWSD